MVRYRSMPLVSKTQWAVVTKGKPIERCRLPHKKAGMRAWAWTTSGFSLAMIFLSIDRERSISDTLRRCMGTE